MTQFVCHYALIQYAPHRDTGEFVNVGVVLVCPEANFFEFRIQTNNTKRITDFFADVPVALYLNAAQAIEDELHRVVQVVSTRPRNRNLDIIGQVFEALIHPREAAMRFSAARTVLTNNPKKELDAAYQHYIQRLIPSLNNTFNSFFIQQTAKMSDDFLAERASQAQGERDTI